MQLLTLQENKFKSEVIVHPYLRYCICFYSYEMLMTNDNEKQRLNAVQKFLQLDLNKRAEFQDIVELASRLCNMPIVLITLLDENVNWLRVRYGTDAEVVPRETSFCQYGIQQDHLLVIPDATKDPRFDDNPLVQSDPNLRFYAGAPLILDNGLKLGTLCVFDVKSNELTELQQKTLTVLSRQVTFLMQLELNNSLLQKQMEEIEAKNQSMRKIAFMQSHEIRSPLTAIMGLVNLVSDGYSPVDDNWLRMMEDATKSLDEKIKMIVKETFASKDLKAIRFNKMIEEIEDYAIVLLDEKGNIENWNKGAEKVKGYKANEIIGKNFSVFYTNEDRENSRPGYLIAEATNRGFARDEGWRVRKDGSKFWGNILITAIHNDDKEVIGFTKVTKELVSRQADIAG